MGRSRAMRRSARAIAMAALLCALAGAPIAGALAVKAAAAPAARPQASITLRGATYRFNGGKCLHVLGGFRLNIGKLTGSRYFTLQFLKTLMNGTYKNGGVLGLHVSGKYYVSKTLTVTLRNHGRSGTFSGQFKQQPPVSSGGSYKGSFSC